uniref:VP1 n=1 Tax=Periparus ater parvoviridae sp. TaxID=2794527 RepID=A0A8A4XDV1_9VIRU|nr:MAG: VP1 [Periparus ater parvoviridae sp.]
MIFALFCYCFICTHTMSAFKQSLSKGGPSTAAEEKVDPIPRHLPSQSVTLNFTQRTWEELAPGSLLYLQLAQTPKYMFDEAMRNQMAKFVNLWHTMEIHQPTARISNLIMLQDDLRVQSNTPTDATAFTQVVYMLEYNPVGQKQYFKLTDHPDAGNIKQANTLEYKFGTRTLADQTTPSQLIEIGGFKDFESLGISGCKSTFTGGFDPKGTVKVEADGTIIEPYVPPNISNNLGIYSGNLRPENTAEYFIEPTYNLTYARNQDKITFHKYGDCVDIPINTNINGMKLANNKLNNFLADDLKVQVGDYLYYGEFAWPSRNRPFISRKQYYADNLEMISKGKDFAPLKHTFFCMPPIRKPNGALLGQRCSFLLEQHISVTLNFNQGTFFPEEIDDVNQVNQDNQIILRPNFYPTPLDAKKVASIYCGDIGEQICTESYLSPTKKQKVHFAKGTCYENTFSDFCQFTHDYGVRSMNFYATFSTNLTPPDNAFNVFEQIDQEHELYTLVFSTLDFTDTQLSFRDYWIGCLTKKVPLKLYFKGVPKTMEPPEGKEEWVYFMGKGTEPILSLNTKDQWAIYPNTVSIDITAYMQNVFFPNAKNKCNEAFVQHATLDKTCTTFFV